MANLQPPWAGIFLIAPLFVLLLSFIAPFCLFFIFWPCGFEDLGYHPRIFSKYYGRRFTKLFWKHKAIRWRSSWRSQHRRRLRTHQVSISRRYSICCISQRSRRFSFPFSQRGDWASGQANKRTRGEQEMWKSQVRGCETEEKEAPSPYSLFFRTRLQFRFLRRAFGNERLLCRLMLNGNNSSVFKWKETMCLCQSLFSQWYRQLYLEFDVVSISVRVLVISSHLSKSFWWT